MGDSAEVIVTVGKIVTEVLISVNPTSGTAPLPITIQGLLRTQATQQPIPNKPIILLMNDSPMADLFTDTNGRFSATGTLQLPGTYVFKARFEGDETFEGCERRDGSDVLGVTPQIPILPIAIVVITVAGLGIYAMVRK